MGGENNISDCVINIPNISYYYNQTTVNSSFVITGYPQNGLGGISNNNSYFKSRIYNVSNFSKMRVFYSFTSDTERYYQLISFSKDNTFQSIGNITGTYSFTSDDGYVGYKDLIVPDGSMYLAAADAYYAIIPFEISTHAVEEKPIDIQFWGDSYTQRYFECGCIAQLLANKGYNPCSYGVGGESVPTILARQGSVIAYIDEEVTLPADGSAVTVSELKCVRPSGEIAIFSPLKQGQPSTIATVNPVVIDGIECTLNYSNNVYTLSRNNIGLSDHTILSGTIINLNGSKLRKCHAGVFSLFANGGFSSGEELSIFYKNAFNYIKDTNGCIGVVDYGGPTYENETTERWTTDCQRLVGNTIMRLRKEMLLDGIRLVGLTYSSQDEEKISQGHVPSALLDADGGHLNLIGNEIVARSIFNKLLNSGIIKSGLLYGYVCNGPITFDVNNRYISNGDANAIVNITFSDGSIASVATGSFGLYVIPNIVIGVANINVVVGDSTVYSGTTMLEEQANIFNIQYLT